MAIRVTELISRKRTGGAETSAPLEIPLAAKRVTITEDIDPADLQDPAKVFHLYVYASFDAGKTFDLVGGASRRGEPGSDTSEPPSFTFSARIPLGMPEDTIPSIAFLAGNLVRVRAYFAREMTALCERLAEDGSPDEKERVTDSAETMQAAVTIEVET